MSSQHKKNYKLKPKNKKVTAEVSSKFSDSSEAVDSNTSSFLDSDVSPVRSKKIKKLHSKKSRSPGKKKTTTTNTVKRDDNSSNTQGTAEYGQQPPSAKKKSGQQQPAKQVLTFQKSEAQVSIESLDSRAKPKYDYDGSQPEAQNCMAIPENPDEEKITMASPPGEQHELVAHKGQTVTADPQPKEYTLGASTQDGRPYQEVKDYVHNELSKSHASKDLFSVGMNDHSQQAHIAAAPEYPLL